MDRVISKLRCRLLVWLRRSRSGPVLFVKHISYKDIKKATDGFHRIVYGSSRGAAYKAKFEHGGVVLVKEARALSEGEKVFYREVQFLGRLHHRHLLPLTGFSNGQKRFLIFDNIENGSLREHLNDPLRTPLNWKIRLQIAVGVAAALEYLLLFSNPPVYHVSISSSNIMLDENFTAKLSDVGLCSSVGSHAESPHSCSEECMVQECNNIVHQIGMLLLELVTGQSSDEGSNDLIQWIQGPSFVSSMHQMIDPDLGDSYEARELKKLLAVARLCLKPRSQPTFPLPQLCRYIQNKVDIFCE